jgi:hypothetical protein
MVLSNNDMKQLLRKRRECGGDRHDEVWNGVYVLSPIANNEHMALVEGLSFACRMAAADALILPGCNVSDQHENWTKNYRVPDVAVFLPGNPAEDRETHWYGGPDFAVEIPSKGDRARKKFDFYARVGVRELLVVDRDPWRLELYRRGPQEERLALVGGSDPDHPQPIASHVLPLTFRLVPGPKRPQIETVRAADGRAWLA